MVGVESQSTPATPRLRLLHIFPGGLYLDIDAEIRVPLREWVRDNDTALLSHEGCSACAVRYGGDSGVTAHNYVCTDCCGRHRNASNVTRVPTVLQAAMLFGPRHPAVYFALQRVSERLHS